MLTTADFKKGLRIELDGAMDRRENDQFRVRGRLWSKRLKNVLTGQVSDRTFKSGDKFVEPDLQMRVPQYLTLSPMVRRPSTTSWIPAIEQPLGIRTDETAQWLSESRDQMVLYNDQVVGLSCLNL